MCGGRGREHSLDAREGSCVTVARLSIRVPYCMLPCLALPCMCVYVYVYVHGF